MHACIDNSDGLYPSLIALVRANGFGVRVEACDADFSEPVNLVAAELGIDPIRFVLGWGDWQLIGAIPPDSINLAAQICSRYEVGMYTVGYFHEDDTRISLARNGQVGSLMPLDSERFAAESWFETGVETYARFMLYEHLIA